MDCSRQTPLSVGFSQARILKWVAMPSSRGSFHPMESTSPMPPALAGGLFTTDPPGTVSFLLSFVLQILLMCSTSSEPFRLSSLVGLCSRFLRSWILLSPSPQHHGNHGCVYSFVCFSGVTYHWNHTVYRIFRLLLLMNMYLRCIHIFCGLKVFFLMLSNIYILLYMCAIVCLFIHL